MNTEKKPTALDVAKRNIGSILPTLKLTIQEHNQLNNDYKLLCDKVEESEALTNKVTDLEVTIAGLQKEIETIKKKK